MSHSLAGAAIVAHVIAASALMLIATLAGPALGRTTPVARAHRVTVGIDAAVTVLTAVAQDRIRALVD